MGGCKQWPGLKRAAWLGAWLLNWTVFGALPMAPFPPAHSTMVLLAGLPGDLESETSFHQQLQSWLDLIEGQGRVARLFILSDAPDAVALPAKIPAKSLKADRVQWLSLAAELSGQTNPLVVIAWGHGGRQGRNPVLHVRGPRLTPEDFKCLADAAAAVPSYWVMLFRESGAFARQVAADGRWILSSEGDTAFTSDPIGMGVLPRVAKAGSERNFAEVSADFATATVAWYRERNLARTEEPTLWAEKANPQLLARELAEETGTPSKPEVKAEPRPAEAVPTGTNPPAAPLPAAWAQIHRVEPRRYPNADGVVLGRRISHTFGSTPAVVVEHDEFIQVLTAEGKRLADFDFAYAPPFEDMTFLDCEVLAPNGKLTRLDPEAVREMKSESVGDYQAGRRKFFSLPGVAPGAVLHVHYRTQWKDFPLPHVSMEVPLGRELPVVATTIEVSLPKTSAFHFALEGATGSDPELRQTGYGTTYVWHFENLAAGEQELLAPPHAQPRLLLSTFPDWRAFAEWYSRLSRLTDTVTPEIEAKAAELTRDAKTEREKVLALYNYVTALRYVAVPLGVNSHRPHAAANVLQNQFGDCKDKANLFNTLLHTLKIEARLVLVPRFSQAYDALPGLAFNHAISRVTLDGQPVWVDTTDDVCRFGLLPPGDPGRKVLVVDGQTEALTQLPAPTPNHHRLLLKGEINCAHLAETLPIPRSPSDRRPGEPLSPSDGAREGARAVYPTDLAVNLTATASGYADYQWRTSAREAKGHGLSLPLLAVHFRPIAGVLALAKQSSTAVSALDQDFGWQAQGECVGLAAISPGKWTVHPPFWLPKEWDFALHDRLTPLFLNQGYPLTLDQEFVFLRLVGAKSAALPAIAENEKEPLRWRVEWAKISDDKVAARLHAELVRGELSRDESALFQRQIRGLLAALAREAVFPTE